MVPRYGLRDMRYSIFGWDGAHSSAGAIEKRRITSTWIATQVAAQPPDSSFDIIFELTKRRWILLTCNKRKFIVTIQPDIFGNDWFVHTRETASPAAGRERFVVQRQTELEVQLASVLDGAEAAAVAAEAVANGASMNDVDRWAAV